MYNTDDVVEGISSQDCFKNLLLLAEDVEYFSPKDADLCYDVLVSCLGVDFRLKFDTKKAPTNEIKHMLVLNSFNSTALAETNRIDAIFKEFPSMVQNGIFTDKYYTYLLIRKDTLIKLKEYQAFILDNIEAEEKEKELAKYMRICKDIDLLDERIIYVEANLAKSR